MKKLLIFLLLLGCEDMITTTGDFDKLKDGQPDFLCEIEYDCLRAEATSSADWTGGTGTADDATKSGSIICAGDTLVRVIDGAIGSAVTRRLYGEDDGIGIRLHLGIDQELSGIDINPRFVSATTCYLDINIYKIDDTEFQDNFGNVEVQLGNPHLWETVQTTVNDASPTANAVLTVTDGTGISDNQQLKFGTTHAEADSRNVYTVQSRSGNDLTLDRTPSASDADAIVNGDNVYFQNQLYLMTLVNVYEGNINLTKGNTIRLEKGTHLIVVKPIYTGGSANSYLQLQTQAITTEVIVNNRANPFSVTNAAHGQKFDFGSVGFARMVDTQDNMKYNPLSGNSSSLAASWYGFEQDITIMDDLEFQGFTDSTMFTGTTDWFQVKDKDGTATTPTSDGIFRVDLIRPEDTDYEIDLYGNASATDTGRTLIQADIRDGDAVTDLYDYYKFEITLESTVWHSTPQLKAVGVYFPIKKTYSINTDNPIIEDVPSINSEIDPLTSRATIDDINFNVLINRPVQGLSEAENLFNDYYLSDAPVSIKQGFKGLDLSSYVGYHTGIISEWSVMADLSKIEVNAKGPLLQSQDKLGIDSDDGFEEQVYNEMNAVEIVRDALRRTNINDRFLNTTSFSDAVTTYDGYNFFYPFVKEPIKDAKKDVIDPISQLLGAALIYKENGQLYYQKLDDDSASVQYTWNTLNTQSIGTCELNLESAKNSCAVQRGYWDQGTFEKSKDKPIFDLEVNETSINDIGLKETLTIENKWIAKDVKISGDNNSKDIAERIVDRFGYGVWVVPVTTSFKYVDLQVGDMVNIEMPQGYIMIKDFADRIYKVRAVVISKQPNPSQSSIDWNLWIYQNISSKV